MTANSFSSMGKSLKWTFYWALKSDD